MIRYLFVATQKVLYVTELVSFRPGVAEAKSAFEAMADIYRYLEDKYNYTVTVVCSKQDSFDDDQLKIRRIPDNAWQPTLPKFPVYPRKLSYRRYVDPLLRNADLVLTVDPTAYQQGALAIRRANKMGTPVWFDASATVNGDFELLQVLRRPVERSLLQQTDRVIATVPKTVERFRDRQLYDETTADAFEVLGHPVNMDKFSPIREENTTDKTVILAVTRLVPEKGLFYILDAVAPVLRTDSTTEFRILGGGPMQDQLARRAHQLNISDDVRFLGTVPHDEVPAVLNTADIFVNHAVANSHWEEFFGLANLEAMACGVPCVVSDCGGIPYVIRDTDVAKLVPQRSVSGIRTAVQQLINNPEARQEMGEHARTYVRDHYSIDYIGDRYHALVQDSIEAQESA